MSTFNSSERLSDKTILITGGTGDVGQALTSHLSRIGANIAILDKNAEKGARLVDEVTSFREINDSNGRAAYFEVNLTEPDKVKEAVSQAAQTFGGIDVLVCGLCTSKISYIHEPNYLAEFERLIDINLKSAVYTTQNVIPFMRGRRRGKIIFLIPDLVRWGSEGESLTSVTRGGLIYYARALARELAPTNISVNCVAMGPTEDYLLARDPAAESIKVAEEKLTLSMPMARMIKPDEIARAITFLASSQSDAVTGQTWAVNGGLTMF
jgi:2-hydroxycyclohexanecarboxyl-CoA dehydrogenase